MRRGSVGSVHQTRIYRRHTRLTSCSRCRRGVLHLCPSLALVPRAAPAADYHFQTPGRSYLRKLKRRCILLSTLFITLGLKRHLANFHFFCLSANAITCAHCLVPPISLRLKVMTKLVFLCKGSRGDVQPLLAIAVNYK